MNLPAPHCVSRNSEHRAELPVGETQPSACCIHPFTDCPWRRIRIVSKEANDPWPVFDLRAGSSGFPIPYGVFADSKLLGCFSLGAPRVKPMPLAVIPQGREVSGIVRRWRQRHCKGETAKR